MSETEFNDTFAIENIIPEETARKLAEFYKIMGDTTRVKILSLLVERELCVGDITEILSMAQSAVSHQLRILRSAHLVTYRKEGKMSYYRLDDDHVTALLLQGTEHLRHKGAIE